VGGIKFIPNGSDIDWSKYEVRLRTSNSSNKVSRKAAHQVENGEVVWDLGDDGVRLPCFDRYSSALVAKIRSIGALGSSGKSKAMAVIWLRDITDGERRTVTAALWQSDDFARLKQNYVPLNGTLDEWDTGSRKTTRIGTLEIGLSLFSGISDAHGGMMKHAADAKRRNNWEEWVRTDKAGIREGAGQVPSELEVKNDTGTVRENAEVKPENKEERHLSDLQDNTGEEAGKKSLGQKFSEFREHQADLHRNHRGVMQIKSARTAEWMRDNIKIGAEKLKSKFDLDGRSPDVETEV
jgi:hypothetical protein